MNGTGDELFPRSRLSRDENGRVSRCDAGDVGEDCSQRRRRPDDLLEHRDALELFAERQVLRLQSLLCPFPIFDVDRRDVPSCNPALLIAKRSVPAQEPAVGSILRTQKLFEIERLAARQLLPSPLNLVEVVGMPHRPWEVGTTKLFDGAAEIVE